MTILGRVCVWRLDRLGRTAKGLLTLLEDLQTLGVGFVSLREGFDLSTPAGRLHVCLIVSGLVGQSWTLFWLALIVSFALCCHSGEIRHRPDPRRAGRGR